MLETVKKWVPITYSAFLDYRVGAAHVSSKGLKIIKSGVITSNQLKTYLKIITKYCKKKRIYYIILLFSKYIFNFKIHRSTYG